MDACNSTILYALGEVGKCKVANDIARDDEDAVW
jgi:hypothetical protein